MGIAHWARRFSFFAKNGEGGRFLRRRHPIVCANTPQFGRGNIISGGGADDGFGFDIDEAASLHGIVDALEQNGDQPFSHRHFIYVEGSQRRVAHL